MDICFQCGADLLPGVAHCPACGAPARSASARGGSFSLLRLIGYIAATVVFVLILILAWSRFWG